MQILRICFYQLIKYCTCSIFFLFVFDILLALASCKRGCTKYVIFWDHHAILCKQWDSLQKVTFLLIISDFFDDLSSSNSPNVIYRLKAKGEAISWAISTPESGNHPYHVKMISSYL